MGAVAHSFQLREPLAHAHSTKDPVLFRHAETRKTRGSPTKNTRGAVSLNRTEKEENPTKKMSLCACLYKCPRTQLAQSYGRRLGHTRMARAHLTRRHSYREHSRCGGHANSCSESLL